MADYTLLLDTFWPEYTPSLEDTEYGREAVVTLTSKQVRRALERIKQAEDLGTDLTNPKGLPRDVGTVTVGETLRRENPDALELDHGTVELGPEVVEELEEGLAPIDVELDVAAKGFDKGLLWRAPFRDWGGDLRMGPVHPTTLERLAWYEMDDEELGDVFAARVDTWIEEEGEGFTDNADGWEGVATFLLHATAEDGLTPDVGGGRSRNLLAAVRVEDLERAWQLGQQPREMGEGLSTFVHPHYVYEAEPRPSLEDDLASAMRALGVPRG